MKNSETEPEPVGPPGRRIRRSPSPSCRISGTADDWICVFSASDCAWCCAARTKRTPKVTVVNAKTTDRVRSNISPPIRAVLGWSITTLSERPQKQLGEKPILLVGNLHRSRAFLVIVCHVVDPRADWIGAHQPSVKGLEQFRNGLHVGHAG